MTGQGDPRDVVVAIVDGFSTGHDGPYAICKVSADYQGFLVNALPAGTSVTFALRVWNDKPEPSEGLYVLLSNLIKKRAGWRAYRARCFRPSDQQRAHQAKSREES